MDARVEIASTQIWERVTAQLKARLGPEKFDHWLARAQYERIKDDTMLIISVPTIFLRNWIDTHYLELIRELWHHDDPRIIKAAVIVRDRAGGNVGQESKPASPPPARRTMLLPPRSDRTTWRPQDDVFVGAALDPRHTFASFVEGPSNHVALAAARNMVEELECRFKPLVIYARHGNGKTHLLQAIGAETLRLRPEKRVVYLTAEHYLFRFGSSGRARAAPTNWEQLRDVDLLLMDDLQFMKADTHEVHLLLKSVKRVVIALDRPPVELEFIGAQMRSFLSGGLALEMTAPDHSMRLGILKHRLTAATADDQPSAISDHILEHVASVVTGNGRDLEGAFNQLMFRCSLEREITIEQVDEILRDTIRTGEPKRVRIEDIQRTVARHYNVSKAEILSNRRTRTIVRPRQVAMYLSKDMTPRSLPEIGRRFGGRDHTTVLHAVRKIEDMKERDTTLAQELASLKSLILHGSQ